jgi:hypothetical protein
MVLTFALAPAMGQVLVEDFDDNEIDGSLWMTCLNGSEPTVEEANQRIEMTLPADSSNGTEVPLFDAAIDIGIPGACNRECTRCDYKAVCWLRGDFDIQVDYELLVWPPSNGVRVSLGTDLGFIRRISVSPWGESYEAAHHDAGVWAHHATGASSGKLRQVRAGGTVTGYYFDSGNWVPVLSSPAPLDDVWPGLHVHSTDDRFADQEVVVAFDNFTVNQGQIVGPPGTCGDEDGDGYRPPEDCDETDATINPDAVELLGNLVDENCDGNLDDLCDPCAYWRKHGQYVRCVAHSVNELRQAGLITEEESDDFVTSAAQSDIGKPGYTPPECQ